MTDRTPRTLFNVGGLSMRRRIVGSVAALSAVALVMAGSAALVVERERIDARIEDLLAKEVAEFRTLVDVGIDPTTGEPFATAERVLELFMQRNVPDEHEMHLGYLSDVTLVPMDGIGTLHTDDGFRELTTSHPQPAYGFYTSEEQGRVRYASLPFIKNGRTSHYVVAYFTDREMAELNDAIRSFALAGTLAWAGLVLAAWMLAGRMLRPVHELRDMAAHISDSDISRRIDVEGDDELAALGCTFNSMLDRLEEALGAQRRMLDDAGHELRTPITVVRGHLELMDEQNAAEVEETRILAMEELDRMSGLVEDLLVLAKSRRPDFLHLEPTDAGDLVRRTLDKAEALGQRRWELDTTPSIIVDIDPNRVTQAMLQLASNAVSVTNSSDTIGMGCSPTPTGVQFWVRDSGPGVPVSERERIFERWEGNRGGEHVGNGLGLAIVKAIATAHEGRAWVMSATQSGGSMFVIEVPGGTA